MAWEHYFHGKLPLLWDGAMWHLIDTLDLETNISPEIFIDSRQQVYYMGSAGHILKFNPENEEWTDFYIENDPDLYWVSNYLEMGEDSKGNLWIMSQRGLYKYDGSGNWTRFHNVNSGLSCSKFSDFAIDQHDNIWIGTACGVTVFNENGIQTLGAEPVFRLEGNVYYDVNEDQQFISGEDIPITQQGLQILPDSIRLFTNEKGRYGLSLTAGEYQVQLETLEHWAALGGVDSANVALLDESNEEVDFRMEPDTLFDDGELYLTGGRARCSYPVRFHLGLRNTGTTFLTGRILVKPDSLTPIFWSHPALTFDPDTETYTLELEEIPPFQLITIEMLAMTPDFQYIGQNLQWRARMQVMDGGSYVTIDSVTFDQIVTCSYDPNDKLAQPSGAVQEGLSLLTDELLYTIRFQNTGNDTAFVVEVRDTLDSNLDLNSFRVLQASHPLQTTLRPDGAVSFFFDNILLPDSTTNEQASHGFLQYAIKVKDGLSEPVEIHNTAYIYFDLNPPIQTNTTENVLVSSFPVNSIRRFPANLSFELFPNPARNGQVFLRLESDPGSHLNLLLYDSHGRLIKERTFSSIKVRETLPLSFTNLPSGVYLVRVMAERGTGAKLLIFDQR